MTGYLARLWRSSARREPALRPVADSVYGAMRATAPEPSILNRRAATRPVSEPPGMAQQEAEGTFAESAPQRSDIPQPQASRNFSFGDYIPLLPARPRGAHRSAAAIPTANAEARAARSNIQPNEAIHNDYDLTEQRRETSAPARRGYASHDSDAPDAPRADEPHRALIHPSEQPTVLQPRAETRPAAEPQAPPRPPPQMMQPRIAAPPMLEAMPIAPPSEPDIQIHIGRVEVVAVTPAPQRAPAPRPNRATSLADYLSRRNGNSR